MQRPRRSEVRQPDGRQVYLYGDFSPAPASYRAPLRGEGAFERRWNPLRREWVLVAAARQDRTFLPDKTHCPLCPSTAAHSSEIPAGEFELAVFDNRFPSLQGAGACEVVVYSGEHEGSFGGLPPGRMELVVDAWTDRYRALARRADVRYVFIFENRGEAVGVTLTHPHGQIYAYPFIPPVAAIELSGRSCPLCAEITEERAAGRRVLIDEDGLLAYVPGSARWPYEVHVAPRRHLGALPDLSRGMRQRLGETLQRIARSYDRLFLAAMPYMMVIHQRPTDGREHPTAHLHAEFYPLLRDRGRLKYLAGSESGAGVFINDTLAEESAERLRAVL